MAMPPPTSSADGTTTPRGPKDYAYLVVTGLAMGAADVVPGVSGGTMAFIMGVYQELVDAIKSVDLALLRKALRFDIRGIFEQVPWRFLLALGAGIGVSFFGLAHGVSWLLEHEQVLLYAFFFGLVLASIVMVGTTVRWKLDAFGGLIAGAALAYWIVGLVPVEAPTDPLTIFLSAMVAISAMILPGISGSFILLILGQYAYVLSLVKTLDVIALLPFFAGCAVGLMAFSRILSWLFLHYERLTVALLVGFMLGSLRKIWPFKEVVETRVDRHGEIVPLIEQNLLPDLAHGSTLAAIGLATLGFILILLLDQVKRRLDRANAPASREPTAA